MARRNPIFNCYDGPFPVPVVASYQVKDWAEKLLSVSVKFKSVSEAEQVQNIAYDMERAFRLANGESR